MSFSHSIIWPEPREVGGVLRLLAALLVAPVRGDAELAPCGACRASGSGSRAACRPGPTTVVCSDWYMFDLGIAM